MAKTVAQAQKRFAEIQKEHLELEAKKSKTQEEIHRFTLKQQELTTELNEILVEMSALKSSGISLPTGSTFKNPNAN